MQCAKCGANNRALAKFCEECGTPLTLACPQCGAAILVGKKFCGDCGASLFPAPLASAQLSSTPPRTHRAGESPSPSHAPASYTPAHLASRIRSGKTAMEGERKIITFLFADIKGSMDILESLDPEESKKLLDPCIQLMMDAVHRAEGTISRVLGDGVMALFGAPLALEDHPHRALYAALRMQETVRRYAATLQEQHDISLQIRVGINTGEVVVGAIGNDLFMEYTPVGHAVGLAARMETLAAPGSTLVTESTYRLTQHAFRFTPRGTVKVKGAKDPFAVYELLGPELSRSRLTTRTVRELAPFVGRSRDLAQLEELATRAAAGQGHVVTLTGEAGVGKSRLLEELKPRLRQQGFRLIEGEGFAYGKTRAYLPLIDMLKRYCGISDQDPATRYREKLQATLTSVDPSLDAFVSTFLNLFGVEVEDRAIADLSAEARLQRILNGVKHLVAFQCRRQPVAFLIEDLHWLDTRSVAFLHALTESITALPVLLLCSSRPEHTYPWEARSFTHKLQLPPLSQQTTASLFSALAGESPSNDKLIQTVCERSGGNPFFLEELVQSLRETGALTQSTQDSRSSFTQTTWTLPPTIQGVLASRLDRLPPTAKNLLQTVAVIGRETSLTLLAQVSDLTEAERASALQILQARELLYESALEPESRYSFKHALTQEVAYHGLLQDQRMRQHERVGDAIEALFTDKLPEHAGLLTYHYSRSANTVKALHYSQLAGRQASALYADTDAQHYWEECLRLLAAQPQTPERDRQEIQTRLFLISVLSRQSNDDTPVRAQFAAAEAVCQRLHEPLLLAKVHATLAVAYVLWGRPQRGLPHARAAKDIADTLQDLHLRVITSGPLAHLLWLAGSFQEALTTAEAGITLVQEHGLDQEQMGFVIHPHAQCLAIAGASRGFLGIFDQGIAALRQAAELTHRHGNRMPQAVVHWGLALVFDLYDQQATAQQEVEQALKIMEEVSPTTGVFLVGGLHEYLTALATPSQVDVTQVKLARTWRERHPFHELAGAWLAALQARAGRQEDACQLARASVAAAEHSGSSWFRYTAHLTLGRLLAQVPGNATEAETHLRAAFDLATLMHSLPFLAHAAVELGEFLWRSKQQSANQRQAERYFRQAADLGNQLAISSIVERASHRLQ